MNVEISGAVISSLFFEHAVCDNDLEGFLLGKIASRCTDIISDAQLNGTKEETTCYISSYITCKKPLSWYKNNGATDVEKLKDILSTVNVTEVVGWYKFRRNSTLIASIREQAIHHHLLDCFPGVLAEKFVFFLCTVQQSVNRSTYTLDHVFQVYNGSCFQGLPMSVINLGDSAVRYKVQGTSSVNCKEGRFAETVHKHCYGFMDTVGHMKTVVTMQNMNAELNEQLQDLCASVWDSEDVLQQLRKDIRHLRAELKPPKEKAPSVRVETNPFKAMAEYNLVLSQDTTLPSSVNPFFSAMGGFHTSTVTSLPDPPPPYSEFDYHPLAAEQSTDHERAKVVPQEVDLIALDDSDEDTNNVGKLGVFDQQCFTADGAIEHAQATLMDTSIPEICPDTTGGWPLPGYDHTGIDPFGDSFVQDSSPSQQTDETFMKTNSDRNASYKPKEPSFDISPSVTTSGTSSTKRPQALEAIEQSSDEDEPEM